MSIENCTIWAGPCTCTDIVIGKDIAFIVGHDTYWVAIFALCLFVFVIGLGIGIQLPSIIGRFTRK